MAPEKSQAAAPDEQPVLASAVNAFTAAVERLESQTPNKVPLHKFKARTPWNPEGKKDRIRLKRVTYQNGNQVDDKRLSEEEISLFNQLRPGRYGPNRKYVVIVRPSDRAVELRYSNKTFEDRLAVQADAKGRGLAGTLDMIVAEAADRKANPKRYENEDLEPVL